MSKVYIAQAQKRFDDKCRHNYTRVSFCRSSRKGFLLFHSARISETFRKDFHKASWICAHEENVV